MNKNKYYNTTSLNLATFLCVKGINIIDIKDGSKRKTFIFDNSDQLDKLVRIFYFGKDNSPELIVNAREILKTLKDIKAKLYSLDYHKNN